VSSSHSASCPCVHKCVSLRFSRFRLAAQGTRHASVAADVYSPHVCWSHPLSCSVGIRGRRADRKGAPSRPQPRRAPSAGRAAPAGGGGGHWQRCPVTAVIPFKDCQHLQAPSLQAAAAAASCGAPARLQGAAVPLGTAPWHPPCSGGGNGSIGSSAGSSARPAQRTHSEFKLRSECGHQVFSVMRFQCGQKLFNAALDYETSHCDFCELRQHRDVEYVLKQIYYANRSQNAIRILWIHNMYTCVYMCIHMLCIHKIALNKPTGHEEYASQDLHLSVLGGQKPAALPAFENSRRCCLLSQLGETLVPA